jgi:hypothetical protein
VATSPRGHVREEGAYATHPSGHVPLIGVARYDPQRLALTPTALAIHGHGPNARAGGPIGTAIRTPQRWLGAIGLTPCARRTALSPSPFRPPLAGTSFPRGLTPVPAKATGRVEGVPVGAPLIERQKNKKQE